MQTIDNYLTNPFCVRKIKEASEISRTNISILGNILRISFNASKDGEYTNIGQQLIADRAGVSRATVNKAIKALISVELIVSTKRYLQRADGLLRRTTNSMFFKAFSDWKSWIQSNKRSAKNAINIIKCKRESLANTISKAVLQQYNITKEHPALPGSTAMKFDLSTGEILSFPCME